MISIYEVRGLPDIKIGDDLSKLITDSAKRQGVGLRQKDVVVLAQKIISKAEGRVIQLSKIRPSDVATSLGKSLDRDPRLVEVILKETKRIVRMRGPHLITETKHGFVCANAGVDHSNIRGRDFVSLLPVKPDRSAEKIRRGIRRRAGVDVAVVVTDTFGRAWRLGHVNFAIGVAGFKPLLDYRGKRDMYGRELRVTVMAVADELAAAAELVMGKFSRVPVAIVRGYKFRSAKGKASELVRPEDEDLFR